MIPKPLFRGYLHAASAPLALVGAAWLAWSGRNTPAMLISLVIYGLALVILFSFSGLYHLGNWGPRAKEVLRRLDHSNIYLLIAGTYTPVAVASLRGAERVGILLGVWLPALAGIGVVAAGLRIPRWLSAILYVAVGWVAILFVPALVRQFALPGLVLVVAGGLCYSAGAVCYALRRPRLWPRVFGFHEAFHVLVIAGSAVYFVFILRYVIPLSPA